MAYRVAKILKIRPNEILDNWGVAELVVTYGQFANEEALEVNESWQQQFGAKSKIKVPKEPQPYRVKFYAPEDLGGDDE